MDIPWYGWLTGAAFLWFIGFMGGRGSGMKSMIAPMLGAQAKAMQMPGLPPDMPGPRGR